MSRVVLVLRDPESPEVNLRCEALGSYLWRLQAVEDQSAALVSTPEEPGSAVTQLARTAGLLSDGDDVRYVPTRPARDRVSGEEDGTWPQSVVSRHRKVVRRSQGAVWRYPLEPRGMADDAEDASVEAFVTDWTGMPSACAMAIHPAHPLSTGLEPGEHASFTGRHCRHPLTGDLLPIWVADWVKAEFGTGAVVLNPGHNQMDHDFCRQVGLPVRFSLAPENYDGAPDKWIKPPFVKSGVAFRAGASDGLPFNQAGNTYIKTVTERGLAEVYTDCGMGAFTVATAQPDGTAEVMWDRRRRTVAAPGQEGEMVRLAPSPILSALEDRVRGAELTVVTPSKEVEGELLALRLLLAEPDIEPSVKDAPEIVVVGNASVKKEADDDALRLALLVNAGTLDTVTIKPQQIETCERFFQVHEDLAGVEPQTGQEVTAEVSKASDQIKGMLTRRDLKQAFTHLYRLQKSLTKSDTVGEQDLLRYHVLAHVLAGVSGPYPTDALAAAWQQI